MRTLLGLAGCTVLAVVVWGLCLVWLCEAVSGPLDGTLDNLESEVQPAEWPW
jgi:hypothetical protein